MNAGHISLLALFDVSSLCLVIHLPPWSMPLLLAGLVIASPSLLAQAET